MPDFLHLHCHTQFSLLDGASKIEMMMDKAAADGQKGVALTDHGNMFGAFKFVAEAEKRNLKPLVGCEFYLVEDRHKQSFSRKRGEKDKRYHQLLIAKDQKGYQNLSMLCSLGFTEGLYNDFPRIDKELLEKYHEGVIATSCCIGAELPQTILAGKEAELEEKLKWWLDLFGEDYYIELQRHSGLEDIDGTGISQEYINQTLIKLARKHNVKIIATNDSHYLEEEDWKAHDILLCINTGNKVEEEKRFRFPSSDFYFKTKNEMNMLFSDIPEALDNTLDIYDKVDTLKLKRDILLPAFPVPAQFSSQEEYLRHLTYEGAKRRYQELNEVVRERLDFELSVINGSGYAGYFLIVQDFTSIAREMDVSVGPGRGSAAGSAVAYCLGITNVDPIAYDLLFERFLNPERISMPDIDIDFDDEGRSKVIDYVVEKYGQHQVAQIITYGSMAAKMSIRDVGRVLDVPLNEVNRISKMYPTHPKANLDRVLRPGEMDKGILEDMNADDVSKAKTIRKLSEEDSLVGEMLRTARNLEGSVRNTGLHACGVIITPDDIRKIIPVAVAKDSDLLVTQFDNAVVEDAGLLKMDFLGLKTLTIIKDAIKIIEKNHGVKIDLDGIPLDDPLTYERIFQKGRTVGVFQYESPGMQKNLKLLEPNKFEDLIAMNALYRPGPMQYIPNFIERKHGREAIVYDLDDMEEYLAETYGITVYQEQVMLLSQKLAGFSKGEADVLRKGMGKKKKKIIDELHPKFLQGGQERGHDPKILEKIWKDWEAFASYAFNKSHSTCYAIVAFQTAYLKAHYPEEFMAAVLMHNYSDISKLEFFLREAKAMGIKVLGPDVNKSDLNFTVDDERNIRIGLYGLKGVGESAAKSLIDERDLSGDFTDLDNFIKRINLRSLNKKSIENLVYSGALDSFGIDRAQYFEPSDKYETFIEHLVRYGNMYREAKNSMENSLFGFESTVTLDPPEPPEAESWQKMYTLEKEKEIVGIYASGHPLDQVRHLLKELVDCDIRTMEEYQQPGRRFRVGGLVTASRAGVSKRGLNYGVFTLQDYSGSYEFFISGKHFLNNQGLIESGNFLHLQVSFNLTRGGDLRHSVDAVNLLREVAESSIQSVKIYVPVVDIDELYINNLKTLMEEHEGQQKIRLTVFDKSDKEVQIGLRSMNGGVTIDNDFLMELEQNDYQYSVLTAQSK
ncbi:DNA polymerase III subunit alpha [Membranicola marinus]|uniref:DNA polymerase III subunit alpha n=1 Tax=Membranihabitans marinus TaxID=1227546 RepID=A0A953HNI2_9BACT|nr:DNA polymerase III subunit alpha [Membranihabitans marinus]MBY5959244.1 DNA polymerase III subunit alpha [Membranihabitans marinus]